MLLVGVATLLGMLIWAGLEMVPLTGIATPGVPEVGVPPTGLEGAPIGGVACWLTLTGVCSVSDGTALANGAVFKLIFVFVL